MTAATEHENTHQGKTGTVYVMNNQDTGNSVTVFNRAADGGLTRIGTFPTGGLGAGNSIVALASADPLISQGSLTISADHRFLFAVNAGSNEVSSLAIQGTTLVPVDRIPSGGTHPVSVTVHQHLLYVVNQTDGTIAGFTIANDGKLSPLAGSTQTLIGGPNAGPAQIQFTPDGTGLVVTERANNVIDVFPVDQDGRASAPVNNPSNGAGPFGFTFVGEDVIIVSESIANANSSYRVAGDGTIKVISGSVPETEQTPCWVVTNSVTDPRYAYVTNSFSGTISGYRIDSNRELTLLSPDGHSAVLRDSRAPIDNAVSSDGQFLYVLTVGFNVARAAAVTTCGKMGISAFRIETDGSLTPLRGFGIADDDPDGLAPGTQGIVAI
ncbi:MAG: lactonase family protein [Pseudonocardiaceae bacterium]